MTMKYVSELRADLLSLYDDIKNDKVTLEKAATLSNCAGKVLYSVRVEMEYAELRKEVPNIEFMGIDESE